jgi:hypothetical protein
MASEMHALRLTESFSDENDPIPEVPAQVAAPIEPLFRATDPEPAVAPVAPHRDIRYERGSTVYALDGPVGTLKQIVIDEDAAEVRS